MSFFENFSFDGSKQCSGRRNMEHTRDLFKMKIIENMLLGHELMYCLEENSRAASR